METECQGTDLPACTCRATQSLVSPSFGNASDSDRERSRKVWLKCSRSFNEHLRDKRHEPRRGVAALPQGEEAPLHGGSAASNSPLHALTAEEQGRARALRERAPAQLGTRGVAKFARALRGLCESCSRVDSAGLLVGLGNACVRVPFRDSIRGVSRCEREKRSSPASETLVYRCASRSSKGVESPRLRGF